MKNKSICLVAILFLLACTRLSADAPTGADLLKACEDASLHGYDSTAGMLCIWYVTPCDCQFDKDSDVPRVCLPQDIAHEKLAEKVIFALRRQTPLQSDNAALAAGKILAPLYPCED